jgi:hypothetical protein
VTTAAPYIARCSVCSVAPFSENDPKGLGYTLKRFPEGQLYCQAHYPPRQHVQRPAPVKPHDALDELEKTFAAHIDALDEAIAAAVGNAVTEVVEAATGKAFDTLSDEQREDIEEFVDAESAADNALAEFQREIERGFATLRKTLSAWEPTKPKRNAAKPGPIPPTSSRPWF